MRQDKYMVDNRTLKQKAVDMWRDAMDDGEYFGNLLMNLYIGAMCIIAITAILYSVYRVTG